LRGALAESWEQSEPLTVTVYLRQGVHWQDRPPVNGREFTADDVQYSYDWILGTGSGFTEPHLFWAGTVPNIERVVATDKYTVQFKLKEPVATAIYQVLEAAVSLAFPIVPHEWVEQGDLQNWKNAVGTGPWIPTDYIVGTSIALSRNPNYWGYDERHPENQLPYADTYKVIAIPDVATSLAALRTGKVDVVTGGRAGVSWQQGASLARTNPEIEQALSPNPGFSLDLRCDTKPFTDIRVRKALQMALDLKSMAKALYGGTVDGTPCGVVNPMYKEWITPYDEWPEELKAEYSFNPEQARELLAEAGYPNGFKTDCVASTDDNMELLQAIKSYFKDIGVDMDIRAMEGYACQAFCQAGKHDQMVFTHGTSMHFGPVESTRYRRSTNTRDNYTFNNDPHYDALVEQLDTATTLDEAKQISFEANLYLLEQHWAVQTFPTAKVTVWQSYLKGYLGENLNPPYPAFVPTRLWIDQELKKSMGY
jgi:peptide/nickel transport system substrate-binding protein